MFIIKERSTLILGRYHYIREKVADGMIVINEVNPDDNVADMLMKALS